MKRWVALLALLLPLYAWALSGEEAIGKSQAAFLYPGQDFKARVLMKLINKDGQERVREMTMLRKDVGGKGEQRYYIYFHEPADVKGTAFLVWKYPARDDDRWIFIPAIQLVRRIAADDKRSSFVGSDFTYEDISGREVEDEIHSVLRTDALDGRPVYVIESRPKAKADYARRLSWIDQERWLPLKEEYFDTRGEQIRVFTADEVRQVGGHWTVTRRTMRNAQSGHRSEVAYTEVEYDVGLSDDLFSERYLQHPPRQWIR